jgi:hypothetical protein
VTNENRLEVLHDVLDRVLDQVPELLEATQRYSTLPDLADDEATGIRGLPHRIGGPRSQAVAAVLLLAASGYVLNRAFLAVEQRVLFWHHAGGRAAVTP